MIANQSTAAADLLDRLTDGIAQLTNSEEWVRYLTLQSRLPKYSFGNCLLIARARPDATMVAGFHAWKSLGRFPRKAERGIRILAPVTVKRSDKPLSDETSARQLVGFRPVVVFDVAQTEGRELESGPCHRLTGDAPADAFRQLTSVANDLGFSVEVTGELPDARNGDCSHLARRIRVHAERSAAQQVKTLAHEIAHAMLHGDGLTPRPIAEVESEGVAFVVCAGMALDSSEYSFGYAATWAGGSDEAIAAIRCSGNRIQRTAATILGSLTAEH